MAIHACVLIFWQKTSVCYKPQEPMTKLLGLKDIRIMSDGSCSRIQQCLKWKDRYMEGGSKCHISVCNQVTVSRGCSIPGISTWFSPQCWQIFRFSSLLYLSSTTVPVTGFNILYLREWYLSQNNYCLLLENVKKPIGKYCIDSTQIHVFIALPRT